uniref:Uncharacterized protein n=1 Tax=Glossina pallidipes TaxID=7398 RepID=A0A1A9ZFR3_GLOPL
MFGILVPVKSPISFGLSAADYLLSSADSRRVSTAAIEMAISRVSLRATKIRGAFPIFVPSNSCQAKLEYLRSSIWLCVYTTKTYDDDDDDDEEEQRRERHKWKRR